MAVDVVWQCRGDEILSRGSCRTFSIIRERNERTVFKEVEGTTTHCSDSEAGGKTCSFAWVTGPQGATKNRGSVQRYIHPYASLNDGWKIGEDMSHGWSRENWVLVPLKWVQALISCWTISRVISNRLISTR